MNTFKIKTICLIQDCEHGVPVWCEQCLICIKPGTRCIRLVCSCGCEEFRSKCNVAFLLVYPNASKKERDKKKNIRREDFIVKNEIKKTVIGLEDGKMFKNT